MDPNLKLPRNDGELLVDATSYRRLVGRLINLTVTRPDISYSVQLQSQFMDALKQPHLAVVNWVLRYIKPLYLATRRQLGHSQYFSITLYD